MGVGHKLLNLLFPSAHKSLSTCDPDSATSTRFTRLVYRLRLSPPFPCYKTKSPNAMPWVHLFLCGIRESVTSIFLLKNLATPPRASRAPAFSSLPSQRKTPRTNLSVFLCVQAYCPISNSCRTM